MKVITRQDRANSALSRYERLYGYNSMLRALGEKPNPEHVDMVMGNTEWTHDYCDECMEKVQGIVTLNDDSFFICFECVRKVARMVEDEDR